MKTETAWWLGSNDAQLLLASLSTLRRYGGEYRLTRTVVLGHLFGNELNRFNQIISAVGVPPEVKNN